MYVVKTLFIHPPTKGAAAGISIHEKHVCMSVRSTFFPQHLADTVGARARSSWPIHLSIHFLRIQQRLPSPSPYFFFFQLAAAIASLPSNVFSH